MGNAAYLALSLPSSSKTRTSSFACSSVALASTLVLVAACQAGGVLGELLEALG
jgi:hypothetical protein